jgi:hypothetical protein
MRIQRKVYGNGEEHFYASVVENRREGKKTMQKTIAYLGVVTAEQVPYLKAAYAKKKPRLVFDDGSG